MKKLTFLCVAVMVTAALIFKAENSFSQEQPVYQLENPGFEEWDGGSDDEPTGWNSFPSAQCDLSGIYALGCSTAKQKKHEKSTDVRAGATGYSCCIYAKTVSIATFSTTANGALTSGQIRIGNTDTNSDQNYNITRTGNGDFNHRLNAKPDSIVFWAKVDNASDESEACCHLYIHDDFDLKDPISANGSGYESHIVGKVPAYNFTNNGRTWQRHSTPIIYDDDDCQSDDPQYVLITFSTNAVPGAGSNNDKLYIDDIEFIYNPIRHEITEAACGHFTWDGTEYTESGDYTKTYDIEGPHDSIVTLHLTITEGPRGEETITECGSYTWNGDEYTESGDYTHVFESTIPEVCDSIATLHLTITDNPSREENVTECDSYTWYEQEYTQSGDYQHTVVNAEGCDSLLTLHLTINNSVTHEFNDTADDSFTWNNETYTTSGDYVQTLYTVNNCDSVVTLHLTITTTGINENEFVGINVYPNPAKDRINIEGAEIKSVSICDIAGREIVEYDNNGESTMNISTEMLESGNYMLIIRKHDGSTATQRVVIMK